MKRKHSLLFSTLLKKGKIFFGRKKSSEHPPHTPEESEHIEFSENSEHSEISENSEIIETSENSDIIEISENSEASEISEISEKPAPQKEKKDKKRLFKIIDLYILKKFLGTYVLANILFLIVIAMLDVTEKLDAFLTAPLKETLFDYFASFLPYFGIQLSPLFVFISVIFFTTKLAQNSEIIAMLSSGISYRRLLRPYMVGAAVLAALTFVMSNYVIPPTNVNRINYTNKYVKNKRVDSGENIQLMVRPGQVAYIGRFENSTKTGYRFSLDKFNGKTLVSRMTASTATYDSIKTYHWTLRDYMIRDFNGMNEHITRGNSIDTIIPIEPKDFLIASNDQETLTTPELSEYIEKQKMRGVANIKKFEIEREKRYASTAAAFILTLIGMSLSAKKVKGGMGLNIGIGLALSFSYILFSTVTSSLAISGLTTPFIAMEIPNVVYLIIGIFLYMRLERR